MTDESKPDRKAQALAFLSGWFADFKVAPKYHAATAVLSIVLFVVVAFFIK